MEELLKLIRERYQALSEDDKDTIRALMGTEYARVLTKIFGTDLISQIRLRKPTSTGRRKRGLGTR